MTKSTHKTNKTNIERSKTSNCRRWEERIAETLKEWARKPDSFMLEEFITNLDLPMSTYYDGVERDPILKEAHKYALTRIGINRERIALERDLGTSAAILFTQSHYLDRWKQEHEFRAKLKAEQSIGLNGNVVIKDWIHVEDTEVVPEGTD